MDRQKIDHQQYVDVLNFRRMMTEFLMLERKKIEGDVLRGNTNYLD